MKTKIALLGYFTLLVLYNVNGQNHHDNNWIFTGLDGDAIVNFSRGFPVVDTAAVPLEFEGASAVISNAAGELQFYTNGCKIYNHAHELMENGAGLNPGQAYNQFCNLTGFDVRGYPANNRSTVIIPWPDRPDQYLISHHAVDYHEDPAPYGESVDFFRHYATHVDMSANAGAGRVVEKNRLLDDRRIEGGDQTLNRHANGVDWWLIVPLSDTNSYSVYLIDSSGIALESIQTIGIRDSLYSRGGGQSQFSPKGDFYVRYNAVIGIQLFDFDRATGQLSNFHFIPMPAEDRPTVNGIGGIGLSPSGQFAYVSTLLTVYQYDLFASDIEDSRVLIAEMQNPDSLWIGVAPVSRDFQLGPDCKLYNYANTGNKHHVIHQPDLKGSACEWEQGGLIVPYNGFRDQPTFPNYRLGPLGDEGSPCAEPLITGRRYVREVAADEVRVYPNPAESYITVQNDNKMIERVEIFDALGRNVLSRNGHTFDPAVGITLYLPEHLSGMHTARVIYADGQIASKTIIIK
jgi:hypothetical protein